VKKLIEEGKRAARAAMAQPEKPAEEQAPSAPPPAEGQEPHRE